MGGGCPFFFNFDFDLFFFFKLRIEYIWYWASQMVEALGVLKESKTIEHGPSNRLAYRADGCGLTKSFC